MTLLPPVALTCGEPAGIGPEICVKAWQHLGQSVPFFWIGDPRHLPAMTKTVQIDHPDQAHAACAQGLPVLMHQFTSNATPGTANSQNAGDVVAVIRRACELVIDGSASAVCTAPINKKVLKDGAGFAFAGHTEFLANISGAPQAVMMLACDSLRVVPTTIHIPLSQVPKLLTQELLADTICITHTALRAEFGISSPRIAVAGLNPHAGENGLMGHEDIQLIAPVIAALQTEGMNLVGPLPADTMFHTKAREKYDAAIAMYHDQALIPIKTLAFDEGVNVTLGLPFVRTSPDHGTAFDIAGQGIANPQSLIAALTMAQQMGQRRAQ